jgi:osmoprotectant transport system permease protein
MPDFVSWFLDPLNWQGDNGVPVRLFEHLAYSGAAILTATIVALPVGLFIGHTGRAANLAINIANIGRALPSYAVILMILPISLAFSPTLGLDPIPTFTAMTLLAIPPILVGAYSGLRAVDRDLIEAGRGMGMHEREILTGIELPVASPVIVGGFRTATLQVIATATIGAVVSGGGLGRYIVDGIHNQQYDRLFAGVILVAALAIGIDLLLSVAQRFLTPRALRATTRTRVGPPEVVLDTPEAQTARA